MHSETHEGLIGAVVWIKDTKIAVQTGLEGEFLFTDLSPGFYTLNSSYIGYEPSGDIKVVVSDQNEEKKVSIWLHEKSHTTSEVEVNGMMDQGSDVAARKQEKESDNVMNVVSARTIELSPDITVGNVAQRVSGVSLVRTAQGDGRYAIIRGMDPRYNNTLVNGVKIPSPNNDNRFIPLDMIPADLLQKLEVHKTLTPDMEADATGGTINAVMKDAPDTTILTAHSSVGYNQIMLERPFSHFEASAVNKKDPSERLGANHNFVGDDFSRKNLDFNNIQADPNTVLGATCGRRLFKKRLGFILSGANQISYSGTRSQVNNWTYDTPDHATLKDYVNRSFSTRQNRTGINFKLDYRFSENHKLTFSNVYLRMVVQESLYLVDTTAFSGGNGRVGPGTGYISIQNRSREEIQQIESGNLQGEHIFFKKLKLDWSATYASATSNQPDIATVNTHQLIDYNLRKNPPYFNSANRSWQRNEDNDIVGAASIQYSFKKSSLTSTLKTGSLYRIKSRENNQNDFTLFPTKVNGSDQVYTGSDNVGWYVYGGVGTPLYNSQNYTAKEYITDYYVQHKLESYKWSAVYGVRFENTEQHWYVPYLVLKQDTIANASRPLYLDVLPSVNLSYHINSKMNLRFGFYKSIVRPQFSEFIPVQSGLGSDNAITKGNQLLKHAIVFNYDIRYEWFNNNKDVLMIGLFVKRINNAIEYQYSGLESAITTKSPINTPTALNKGFEVNVIKYLDKIHVLRNVGINFNYTFTISEVTTQKSELIAISPGYNIASPRNETRTLQNQSRDLFNACLIYNVKKIGLNIQLSYLYQGKRLINVQTFYGLDWYQKPFQNISFSAEKKLGGKFYLTMKLNNLLNSPYDVVIGRFDLTVQNDTYGQNYQLGARYKF